MTLGAGKAMLMRGGDCATELCLLVCCVCYLIPVGVCCRDDGFEGVSLSFWCLVFLVLYLVSVYMVLGVCV